MKTGQEPLLLIIVTRAFLRALPSFPLAFLFITLWVAHLEILLCPFVDLASRKMEGFELSSGKDLSGPWGGCTWPGPTCVDATGSRTIGAALKIALN